MKIEITDRKMWLERVKKALEVIESYRKQEDEEYVTRWRNKKGLFGRDLKRQDKMPLYTCYLDNDNYPSVAGANTKYVLDNFKTMLETEGTGALFIGEKEVGCLILWENREYE